MAILLLLLLLRIYLYVFLFLLLVLLRNHNNASTVPRYVDWLQSVIAGAAVGLAFAVWILVGNITVGAHETPSFPTTTKNCTTPMWVPLTIDMLNRDHDLYALQLHSWHCCAPCRTTFHHYAPYTLSLVDNYLWNITAPSNFTSILFVIIFACCRLLFLFHVYRYME